MNGTTPANSSPEAKRYLRTFAVAVVLVATLVASINIFAFRYMLKDENQAIVQMLSGWGRIYKPILYDHFEPEVAVFGASWARDAFDPITIGRLLQKHVFNFAVSSASIYETRRFADDSLQNPNLESAIVNLDTVYSANDQRTKYGFDEALLNVDGSLNPNPWAWLKRTYSLAFTGWAVSTNIELMSAILARDSGADESEYLPSYEHADMTARRDILDAVKNRIYPDTPRPAETSEPIPLTPFQESALAEFGLIIDRFCDREIDTYAYFTPLHQMENSCDASASLELKTLNFLRQKQATCAATISYWDFGYPNAVTLEGVTSPVSESAFYRPDGHPRPTAGELMTARMFDLELPANVPADLQNDFGVELLTHPDAEGWLHQRAARCDGNW
jgi:hypothetical protein